MRPYATIHAFLAEEQDTFSRTAVTLIGAPTRPRGVVIRFEVTLSDGTPVLRGEGRVLGFQAADEKGPSALTLRFTRLDARSKALVDRVAAQREGGIVKPAPPETPSEPEAPRRQPEGDESIDPLAATTMGTTVPEALGSAPPALVSPPAISSADLVPAEALSAPTLPDQRSPVPAVAKPAAAVLSAVADREALLERLRSRAKTLSPTQVATILSRST